MLETRFGENRDLGNPYAPKPLIPNIGGAAQTLITGTLNMNFQHWRGLLQQVIFKKGIVFLYNFAQAWPSAPSLSGPIS